MAGPSLPIISLAEFEEGREADCFVLLSKIEEARTRDGKVYFRLTMRDAGRELTFPLWSDSPWYDRCRDEWQAGEFYKLRAVYRETQFGPQLDLKRVRPAGEADRADGFDPLMCVPRSKYDPLAMFAALRELVDHEIGDERLRKLVGLILEEHRDRILDLPAAVHHHHAFRGGFLEHLLSTARNGVFLARKYAESHAEILPPLGADLVIAGSVLHDIGKLAELRETPSGAEFSPEGELIGHIVLGRDLIREYAVKCELDRETQLRLEHIVISHQRSPEWGSPKPPMTPEALLVFYADDLDARFQMLAEALQRPGPPGIVTSKQNPLGQKVFRGLSHDEA